MPALLLINFQTRVMTVFHLLLLHYQKFTFRSLHATWACSFLSERKPWYAVESLWNVFSLRISWLWWWWWLWCKVQFLKAMDKLYVMILVLIHESLYWSQADHINPHRIYTSWKKSYQTSTVESCSKLPGTAVSHPSLVDAAEECRRLSMAVKGKLGLTQNDLSSTLRQTRFKSNTEGQMSRWTGGNSWGTTDSVGLSSSLAVSVPHIWI